MYASTNPKQPFYVANKIFLTPRDQKNLIKLYQPLVGMSAVGLYTTLVNEFDTVPFAGEYKTLYQLQDQTTSDLKKIFNDLHHLEAVGLLKTYKGENPVLGDVLIFKLIPVPSAQEFFQTFLLSSLLQERVGTIGFEKIVKEFTPREFSGLENADDVSAGFFDVFHLNSQTAIEPPATVKKASSQVKQETAPNNNLELGQNQSEIDWDFLITLFSSYHISKEEVEKNQQKIAEIINFYDLGEQEFVLEATNTLTAGQKELNMSSIARQIRENFGNQRTRKQVKLQLATSKKDALAEIKKLSKTDNDLLKEVGRFSSIEYLYDLKRKKGGYVTASEKSVVYRLQNQYGLTPELINVLIHTCLEYDSVLTTTLADRIANNWLQKGVTTATQAINYVHDWQSGKLRKKNNSQYKQKRVKKGTDWDKYRQQSKGNNNSTSSMSDEEMNQIFNKFGKKD